MTAALPGLALGRHADTAPGPQARYPGRETIELAFTARLAGWRRASRPCCCPGTRPASPPGGGGDAGQHPDLDQGHPAAGTRVTRRWPTAAGRPPAPLPGSAGEQAITWRLAAACAAHIDGVIALASFLMRADIDRPACAARQTGGLALRLTVGYSGLTRRPERPRWSRR